MPSSAPPLALFALYPLRVVANRTISRIRPDEGRLLVELAQGGSASALLGALEEHGVRVRRFEIEDAGDARIVTVDAVLPTISATAGVLDDVNGLEHVRRVEWQT